MLEMLFFMFRLKMVMYGLVCRCVGLISTAQATLPVPAVSGYKQIDTMKKIILVLFIAPLFFASCVKDAATGTATVSFQLKAATSAVNGAGIVWTIGTAGVANTK